MPAMPHMSMINYQSVANEFPAPGFIKRFLIILFPFAQLFLFFFRQVIDMLTGNTAASVIFICTFRTLNKKQMAGVVPAIGMCIGRFAALIAMSYYFFCNLFAKPLFEHE